MTVRVSKAHGEADQKGMRLPKISISKPKLAVSLLICLIPAMFYFGYAFATPAPSRSATIEPGFSTDCTEYLFIDGTTPVAHPGNSGPNIVGTAGQDFGIFINQFLGTSGNYCIESGTNPTYSTTWSITTSNVQIISQRGNIFTYSGTGTAIIVSNVHNVVLMDIELGATQAAKVALELDGVSNCIIEHYQDGYGAGSFVHSINLNGTVPQPAIFNLFEDVITSFPTYIGATSGASQTANANTFVGTRFTAQVVIGLASVGDAPVANAMFGGGLNALPATTTSLINSGSGTVLDGVDCEQTNLCLQNGVVGSSGLAKARAIISGGYWAGSGGGDGNGFGITETAGAGNVRIINVRGTSMTMGLPSPSSVTAGASIWTYTNGDAFTETMTLFTVAGITAWTCNGTGGWIITQNSFCLLNSAQTMTVTWATTAPVFEKQAVQG